MGIQTIQTAFAESDLLVPSLTLTLPRPTTVGNTLSLHLRFSPLTGTPVVSDNFGNRYRVVGATTTPSGEAVAWFAADLARGGAGHVITVTAQGGSQALAAGVVELSAVGPCEGETHSERDVMLAILVEQQKQTALLQSLLVRNY